MLPLATDLEKSYEALLLQHEIPVAHHPYYKKWLRYFLDFCAKSPSAPKELIHQWFFSTKKSDVGAGNRAAAALASARI